ncbi:MAG: hypothetical protein RLO52_35550 [Sandaracinaceae bacterium]
MTSRRSLLLASVLLLACGGESVTDDAGRSRDGGGADAGATADGGHLDAGTDVDSGADPDSGVLADAGPTDAGVEPDSGAGDDAGSACPTRIDDRIAGACDGRGMAICRMWAQDNGGSQAVAQCVASMGGRCARADTCDDRGCRCGDGPECGDAEMCVSGFAGFTCVCIER